MVIVVFAGPTVRADQVKGILPTAECRGPAECGDIYRAVAERPRAIGLVDGYFDHRLSVWHKEILWALSHGVRIYGAASMGALRAAELAAFGMVGVGRIFEMYNRGVLEDDDEIAVIHEAADREYAPQSEALVNLRATLGAAVDAEAIDRSAAACLVSKLKEQFYPLRTSRTLMAVARKELSLDAFDRFAAWFDGHGIVNQKQFDALAMIRKMAADERDASGVAVDSRPKFVFQYTDAWDRLVSRNPGSEHAPTRSGNHCKDGFRFEAERNDPSRVHPSLPTVTAARAIRASDSISKLRAEEPAIYANALELATHRAVALLLAAASGSTVSASEVQKESEKFRRERELVTPDATQDWLRENRLDLPAFSEFVHDTVLTRGYDEVARKLIADQLPHALRLIGRFPRG